ncbi:hypothetical protein LTS10_008214 [Elasticomyces elasticus]|nr:hypothetical protein LTS10_008214 [Elasticomyces elasticus]
MSQQAPSRTTTPAPQQPTMTTLAAAKLARQNKRIEQAEAALTAPPPTDRDRQTPRAKGKKTIWMPLDLTADATAATQASEVSMPATEIRINTFRAPATRESSLSRSMSSLSQRTKQSDMEGGGVDGNGFQLFTGRKNRKVADQLNVYEEKPEVKQTTVEAVIDKREIYEVFGNALPGNDYLQENPGAKDGQIQFVQHPNGDVAAHQWSAERFLWDNIGQYSNIRKKIQGQLAADRLKGETAYQTLQQNTLAYFRTVAKQREATTMGLPFGLKEIQAALPDLRPAQPTPPTLKRQTTATEAPTFQTAHDTHAQADDQRIQEAEADRQPSLTLPFSYEGYPGYNSMGYGAAASYGGYYGDYSSAQSGYPYGNTFQAPAGPRSDRYNNNYFQSGAMPNMQDPFYTQQSQSYRNIYGGLPTAFGGMPAKSPGYGAYGGYGEKPAGLNYDYNFPATGSDSTQPSMADRRDSADPRGIPGRRFSRRGLLDAPVQAERAIIPPPPRATTSDTDWPALRADAEAISKAAAPLSVRNSMRHQLFKISDQAKERNLSQANIRTVLHDPFSPQSSTAGASVVADEPVARQEHFPELKKTVANPSGLPQSMQPASVQPLSMQSAVAARAFVPGRTPEKLQTSSSPDTYWTKKNATTVTPHSSSASRLQEPTPAFKLAGTLEDLLAEFETKAKNEDEEARATGGKTWDQKLDEWWKNGSTFQRHEDMFKTIKDSNMSYMTMDPPGTLDPIGTPAKSKVNDGTSAQAKYDAHTRLLVPVLENLASYVQGPVEKRRDYFSQWTQPPEWAIDRNDNTSFYDKEPWAPPARVGRDPRYRPLPVETTPARYGPEPPPGRYGVENVRFGAFGSPTASAGSSLAVGAGLERRFAYGRT